MVILSIANQKGGVGKTTTAFNLGAALAQLDQKVLFVDNDPQGNLTSYALAGEGLPGTTIDDIYVTRRKPLEVEELVEVGEKMSILAADAGLMGAEHYLVGREGKEFVLRTALRGVAQNFDYVIIDNPPALSLLTINGLVASNAVLVPVQLEFFSLEGVVLLQRTINSLQDRNPGLRLLGILPNMFNDKRKLNWEVLNALQDQFKDQLLQTKIHDSVKIAESSGHGKSILKYAPRSRSTEEFLSLAQEVISHAEHI